MSVTKEIITGSINFGFLYYIQFITTVFSEIVLARLLMPEDFGKIGYIISIITIGFMFSNFALESTIIQNVRWDHDQYGFNAFFLNLMLLSFLSIILFLFAKFSKRLDTYIFTAIMISQALCEISVTYKAFMQLKMQFFRLGLLSLISHVISITGAIYLAYYNFGYMSLVYKIISFNLLNWLLCWLFTPMRFKLKFDKEMLIDIINFGKYSLISNILDRSYRQIDNVTIGYKIGDEELGYYKRAYFFSELFSVLGYGVMAPVLAPFISSIQNKKDKLSQLYFAANLFFFNLTLLFYLLTGCLTVDMITFVFGAKWLPIAPIFWFIIPYGIICPIRRINRHFHLSTGRSKEVTIAQFFEVVLFLLCLFPFLYLWGTKGVAMAVNAGAMIGIIFLLRSSSKFLDFKIKDIFLKPMLLGIITLVIFLMVRSFVFVNNILARIILHSLVISVIYCTGIIIIDYKKLMSIYLLVKKR